MFVSTHCIRLQWRASLHPSLSQSSCFAHSLSFSLVKTLLCLSFSKIRNNLFQIRLDKTHAPRLYKHGNSSRNTARNDGSKGGVIITKIPSGLSFLFRQEDRKTVLKERGKQRDWENYYSGGGGNKDAAEPLNEQRWTCIYIRIYFPRFRFPLPRTIRTVSPINVMSHLSSTFISDVSISVTTHHYNHPHILHYRDSLNTRIYV